MTHKGTVTLETERFILRPFTMDDYDAVHSWKSNPANTRYSREATDEAGTSAYLEKQIARTAADPRLSFDFAVVIRETEQLIGCCGIYVENGSFDTAGLGWIIHIDHWSKGYGTEFCRELLRFGFEDLHLRRITAYCAAANHGSYRAMEHNGMRREATKRKAFWTHVDKEWIDEYEYAILAEDYFGKGKQQSQDITIRLATESDIAVLAKYDKHIPAVILSQKIANGEIYVAYDGETFVGWLRYSLFWDNTPFMNMLFVFDGNRGTGIGKKLTLFWEEQMRSKGYKTLMTSTQQNETEQHFYRHLGYISIGVFMKSIGEYVIIFSKDIGE
jgi:RimJ/RimL family protein N-acetyltransferase